MRRQPKRVKFRKCSKGGLVKGMIMPVVRIGIVGLVSIDNARLSARQIEAARRSLRHTLNRKGNVWTCVFPDTGITKKPIEVRMGKGTGSVAYWATIVRPGSMLFEVSGVPTEMAIEALLAAGKKLPMGTRRVSRVIGVL